MLQALSTFSISNAVPIAHCSFLLSLSLSLLAPSLCLSLRFPITSAVKTLQAEGLQALAK